MRNAVVAIAVVIVIALAFLAGLGSSTVLLKGTTSSRATVTTITATTTEVETTFVTTSFSCIITGQPGGIFLRVLSSATSTPVSGAIVAAVNQPFGCDGGPATPKTVETFTTNDTEWYPLPSDNNAAYWFLVAYAGKTYNFTANLQPVSLTCATIFLPSGVTNVTITEFGEECASTVPSERPPLILSLALANLSLPGYPSEIAVNANTSKIYVSDLFANKLTVINASTFGVIGTITLPGTAETGIAVDQKNGMVYVPVSGCTNEVNATNSCDSSSGSSLKGGIVQIYGTTDKIVGEFAIEAQDLIFDPNTGVMYGTSGTEFSGLNASTGSLVSISLQTGSIVANTTLGAYPLSLALNPGTDVIYVGACKAIPLPCLGAEVLVVNGLSLVVQMAVPLDFDALNFNVVVDQATDTVYTMGLTGSNLTLAAIDGVSGAVEYLTPLGSSCAGAGGGTLAIDSATHQVLASFQGQQFLLLIDGSTGKMVSMINATGGIYFAAFNPTENRWYVTTPSNGNYGYLLALPGIMSQSYVNPSLLQLGICLP